MYKFESGQRVITVPAMVGFNDHARCQSVVQWE